MVPLFSPRQNEFIDNSNSKFNLAHGAVSSGKTVASLFRFMQAVEECNGNSIWIIGYSQGTIYRNVISQLFDKNNQQLGFFRYFCTWKTGNSNRLIYKGKEIQCVGAGDQGSLGIIQGSSIDLALCDEMTLYPSVVLDMITTRIRPPGSQLFGTMNPVEPSHKCKEMIDTADKEPSLYYQLHFKIDDNPFLEPNYIKLLQNSLSGLFYRRYYLGEWCLAEGAIFDFFEKKYHTVVRPPRSAEFYLAAVDYGASNPFAALIVGYNSGRSTQTGAVMWVEKEYYWDPKKMNRQKTNSEFRRDLEIFFEGYPIKHAYIDPSAASFKAEMRGSDVSFVDADNDVFNGIQVMTNLMKDGSLTVCQNCVNLIREIEGYCWDSKKSERGEDAPLKKADHLVDCLRYICKSFLGTKKTIAPVHSSNKDFGRNLGWNSNKTQFRSNF